MGADSLPPALLLLTVEAVAKTLGVSVRSVRTLIALGELPVVRVGARAIRIAETDLAAFIQVRRREARPKGGSHRRTVFAVDGPRHQGEQPREPVSGGDGSATRPVEVNGDDRSELEARP